MKPALMLAVLMISAVATAPISLAASNQTPRERLENVVDLYADVFSSPESGEGDGGSCSFTSQTDAKGVLTLTVDDTKLGRVRLAVGPAAQVVMTEDREDSDGSTVEAFLIDGKASVTAIHADDAYDKIILEVNGKSLSCGQYY